MLKLLWFILNFWLELCAAKYRLHVWWAGPLNLADISVADFILFCSAGNRIFVYFVTDSCVDFKESVELMRHRGLLGCGCVRLLNASAPVTGSDNLAAADTAHAAARASALCTISTTGVYVMPKKVAATKWLPWKQVAWKISVGWILGEKWMKSNSLVSILIIRAKRWEIRLNICSKEVLALDHQAQQAAVWRKKRKPRRKGKTSN